jgi:lipopolysaccharide transport system permease protein
VWRLRYFWFALVRGDLRKRYRGSLIGIGWSLLHPIAMTIILCTVFGTLFRMDVQRFAPYLLSGLVTWSFLVAALLQGCQCFIQGEAYIRQVPAPLAIYPLRATLAAGFHFLLGLVVVVLLSWTAQGFHNLPALPWLLPAMGLLFLLGWSLTVCTGAMHVLFQDTQHLLEVLVQALFYLTPIIYPAALLQERGLGWFVAINPAAAFLEMIRAPLLEGQPPTLGAMFCATLATIFSVSFASLILWKLEKRMVFYL